MFVVIELMTYMTFKVKSDTIAIFPLFFVGLEIDYKVAD